MKDEIFDARAGTVRNFSVVFAALLWIEISQGLDCLFL